MSGRRKFLNPDPLGFGGGLNFYAYANGNPVSYLDPFGLDAFNPGLAFYFQGPGSQQRVENLCQNIETVNYALAGVAVGVGTAGIVTLAAPAAVTGLTALGMSETAASATVTTTLWGAGAVGAVTTGADIYRNANAGNWNGVAFDAGTLLGGGLVGTAGGGRFIADNVGALPSSIPVGANPFTAEAGMGYNPNYPGGSLLSWLASAPTPASGGAAATGVASGIPATFNLFTGQNAVDWLGNPVSSSSTGKH